MIIKEQFLKNEKINGNIIITNDVVPIVQSNKKTPAKIKNLTKIKEERIRVASMPKSGSRFDKPPATA